MPVGPPPLEPGGVGADDGGDPGGGSGGRRGGASADTRAAPPGGNGGATDVGVTADRILIYNVADLTGAVPGLFRDAYEATLAYIQYFTATEGTVYGRQIVLESRDTQLSAQGNRAAYLDACENAFTAVGSMSAFEEGAAEPLRACGMPDLRNVRTSKPVQQLDNVFGLQAVRPGDYSRAEWEYYKQQFPDAITNAGFVWLENQTTNYQVGMYIKGTTRDLGYQWNEEDPGRGRRDQLRPHRDRAQGRRHRARRVPGRLPAGSAAGPVDAAAELRAQGLRAADEQLHARPDRDLRRRV